MCMCKCMWVCVIVKFIVVLGIIIKIIKDKGNHQGRLTSTIDVAWHHLITTHRIRTCCCAAINSVNMSLRKNKFDKENSNPKNCHMIPKSVHFRIDRC